MSEERRADEQAEWSTADREAPDGVGRGAREEGSATMGTRRADEPAVNEPAVDEPVVDEPAVDEPADDHVVAAAEKPAAEQPSPRELEAPAPEAGPSDKAEPAEPAEPELEEAEPEPEPEPAEEEREPEPLAPAAAPEPAPAPAPQVRRAMRRRATRNQLLIATLCGLLGFALALQVRSNQTADTLRTARQSDLVRILDDLEERSSRLRAEARELETTRDRLTSGVGRSEAALEEASQRADTLGILAGNMPATGRGIELVISDPGGEVNAAILLDALQEMRDAGAEAVQIDDVRVVASTHFTDTEDGVSVDDNPISSPYRFIAIGEPSTLASALNIPGGVLDTVKKEGAQATVTPQETVVIEALHLPETPKYARPAPQPT